MKTGKYGFTLIELLVTIGIIGVLVSISLPALGGARASGQRLKSLANVRSIGDTFANLETEDGNYPTQPTIDLSGAGSGGWVPGGGGPMMVLDGRTERDGEVAEIRIIAPLWELGALWPFPLMKRVEVSEHLDTWFSPGRPAATPGLNIEEMTGGGVTPPVSYRYSHTFLARPGLWSSTPGEQSEVVAPVRASDVVRPASKVMLWDADLAFLTQAPRVIDNHYASATPMAFADGHGDVRNPAEAREGVPNPLNNGSSMRLHNTPDGVAGADY